MTKKDNLTILDIAKLANVSTATVSRVLSGKDKVSEDTKRHVMNIVHQYGYDVKKRSLLSDQESKTVLVCVTELKNPFNVPIFDGIQNSAKKHGYDVLILQTKDMYTKFTDYESVLMSQKFAGVIFVSTLSTKEFIEITNQLHYRCPIVCCSEYLEDCDVSYVGINDIEAMQKATSYLLSVGRQDIMFINSKPVHNYARKRERGFRQAMSDAGVIVNENMVVRLSSVTHSLAYSAALNFLSQEERPNAILCVSDVYAIAALKACQKLGLRVPEDCAIVGFDGIELTTMVSPSLTTIEQPSYQLGYQSFELLIEKIQYPSTPTKKIILETEFIVRGSTPINIFKGGFK